MRPGRTGAVFARAVRSYRRVSARVGPARGTPGATRSTFLLARLSLGTIAGRLRARQPAARAGAARARRARGARLRGAAARARRGAGRARAARAAAGLAVRSGTGRR